MASGWVKSLQCKSRAFEDVYHHNPKNLIPTASCGKSVRSIKDVIETTKHKPKPKRPKSTHQKQQQQEQPGSKYQRQSKAEPVSTPTNRAGVGNSSSDRTSRAPDPYLPALTELAEGHPSRNVVEIIFHTSWSPKAFVGKVEMIFKVQNGSKTVSRFDEYREAVKYRAGSGAPTGAATCEENARCVADGNEVMRFYCLGPTSGGAAYDARGGGAWAFPGAKGSAICTFSGSGGAHESAGGGRGRRAMLVCRVIAGRVSDQLRVESLLDGRVGFDSVSGENGELLVFDSRAVLPCFLIIYKL